MSKPTEPNHVSTALDVVEQKAPGTNELYSQQVADQQNLTLLPTTPGPSFSFATEASIRDEKIAREKDSTLIDPVVRQTINVPSVLPTDQRVRVVLHSQYDLRTSTHTVVNSHVGGRTRVVEGVQTLKRRFVAHPVVVRYPAYEQAVKAGRLPAVKSPWSPTSQHDETYSLDHDLAALVASPYPPNISCSITPLSIVLRRQRPDGGKMRLRMYAPSPASGLVTEFPDVYQAAKRNYEIMLNEGQALDTARAISLDAAPGRFATKSLLAAVLQEHAVQNVSTEIGPVTATHAPRATTADGETYQWFSAFQRQLVSNRPATTEQIGLARAATQCVVQLQNDAMRNVSITSAGKVAGLRMLGYETLPTQMFEFGDRNRLFFDTNVQVLSEAMKFQQSSANAAVGGLSDTYGYITNASADAGLRATKVLLAALMGTQVVFTCQAVDLFPSYILLLSMLPHRLVFMQVEGTVPAYATVLLNTMNGEQMREEVVGLDQLAMSVLALKAANEAAFRAMAVHRHHDPKWGPSFGSHIKRTGTVYRFTAGPLGSDLRMESLELSKLLAFRQGVTDNSQRSLPKLTLSTPRIIQQVLGEHGSDLPCTWGVPASLNDLPEAFVQRPVTSALNLTELMSAYLFPVVSFEKLAYFRPIPDMVWRVFRAVTYTRGLMSLSPRVEWERALCHAEGDFEATIDAAIERTLGALPDPVAAKIAVRAAAANAPIVGELMTGAYPAFGLDEEVHDLVAISNASYDVPSVGPLMGPYPQFGHTYTGVIAVRTDGERTVQVVENLTHRNPEPNQESMATVALKAADVQCDLRGPNTMGRDALIAGACMARLVDDRATQPWVFGWQPRLRQLLEPWHSPGGIVSGGVTSTDYLGAAGVAAGNAEQFLTDMAVGTGYPIDQLPTRPFTAFPYELVLGRVPNGPNTYPFEAGSILSRDLALLTPSGLTLGVSGCLPRMEIGSERMHVEFAHQPRIWFRAHPTRSGAETVTLRHITGDSTTFQKIASQRSDRLELLAVGKPDVAAVRTAIQKTLTSTTVSRPVGYPDAPYMPNRRLERLAVFPRELAFTPLLQRLENDVIGGLNTCDGVLFVPNEASVNAAFFQTAIDENDGEVRFVCQPSEALTKSNLIFGRSYPSEDVEPLYNQVAQFTTTGGEPNPLTTEARRIQGDLRCSTLSSRVILAKSLDKAANFIGTMMLPDVLCINAEGNQQFGEAGCLVGGQATYVVPQLEEMVSVRDFAHASVTQLRSATQPSAAATVSRYVDQMFE